MREARIDSYEIRSITLLRPRSRYRRPTYWPVLLLYAISLAAIAYTSLTALRTYRALPAAAQVMAYPQYLIDEYAAENMTLPEMTYTTLNILEYHDVGLLYRTVKFSLLVPISVHLVVLMLQYWLLPFRIATMYDATADPALASEVHAVPYLGYGRPVMLRMQHTVMKKGDAYVEDSFFYFQQRKYLYDASTDMFVSPVLLTCANTLSIASQLNLNEAPSKRVVERYRVYTQNREGLSARAVVEKTLYYGPNRLVIPLASLASLFMEHFMSPFFIFQVVTCFLWSLDNFAFYSFFSLFVVVFMEGGNVFSKYNSIKESRKMIPPACKVEVKRDGRWVVLPSDRLVPTDLVRISMRHTEEGVLATRRSIEEAGAQKGGAAFAQVEHPLFQIVKKCRSLFLSSEYPRELLATLERDGQSYSNVLPAELVVLSGSIVVDESLLTGESTTQIKDPISEADDYADGHGAVNLDRDHAHILFSGTRIVSVIPSADEEFRADNEGGEYVLCAVLRTGFETSQGQLVRKIVFDTERLSATDRDAVVFLGLMLVAAVAAALYTFLRGRANRICPLNRLILQSLIVFVSVLPPEIPMHVSMVVSTSIQLLRKAFIYCTEPFKVINAGRVRVCCFDKTGTLVSEKVDVLGVVTRPGADSVAAAEQAPREALLVLAGCQSLLRMDGLVSGDPLEMAVFGVARARRRAGAGSLRAGGAGAEGAEGAGSAESAEPLFRLTGSNRVVVAATGRTPEATVDIERRYAFTSKLKRMSVQALVTGGACGGRGTRYLLTKGAPETLKGICLASSVPAWHDEELTRLTRRGYRVLTLCYRELGSSDGDGAGAGAGAGAAFATRGDAERDLLFAGFLVTDSPLKADTKKSITLLRNSGHRCAVISGDNILNVTVVGERCGIIAARQPTFVLTGVQSSACVFSYLETDASMSSPAVAADGFSRTVTVTPASVVQVSRRYALAATNDEHFVALLMDAALSAAFLPRIKIFARATPEQKAIVVRSIQTRTPVLFCGDGSNDTEGLRSADVGVALLETADYQDRKREADTLKGLTDKQARQTRMQQAMQDIPKPSVLGPFGRPATQQELYQEAKRRCEQRRTRFNDEYRFLCAEQRQYVQRLKAVQFNSIMSKFGGGSDGVLSMWSEALSAEEESTSIQLGDASLASPFTAKSGTLAGVLDIIRQGRCTIVTILMSYKTIALQCLVSAYSMTVLTLDGVRSSDSQLTANSLLSIAMLLYIDRAKPLEAISSTPAPTRVIGRYCLTSLVLQAVVHIAILHMATYYLGESGHKTTVDFDVKFQPSMTNTVIFLVRMFLDLSINVVNYPGEPYMTAVRNYPALLKSFGLYILGIACLSMQWVPELNETMGLLRMPPEIVNLVLLLGVGDVLACLLIEKVSISLFGPKPLDEEDL